MVAPTEALPPPPEREALLDALAELVEQCGFEGLVCAPLLLPEPTYFPDPWTPDARGVRRLALRLMRYAGLEALRASVELFDEDRPPPTPTVGSEHHQGAAAWFAGIDDGVARFGANVDQLEDPMGVTAALAHEVAHAFRFHHGLVVDDRETEEQLTDLTTVYLGFGLLTTNVTVRHRSGVVAGTLAASRYQRTMLGYLPPQAMSLLLACHQHLRGAKAKHVADRLELNQAHYYRAARRWLDRSVPNLAERLGIPPRETWPDPWSMRELVAPLDLDDLDDGDDLDAPQTGAMAERESAVVPVFRLGGGNNALVQLVVWLVGGVTATILLASHGWPGSLVVLGCTALLSRALGNRQSWRCSGCDMRVRPQPERCPYCHGLFVRDLRDPADRLELDPWAVLRERSLTTAGSGGPRDPDGAAQDDAPDPPR